MRFQPQAAVLPQLSFGAEAVRRLHHRDQNGCPDRTDPRNLAQQFPRLVLPALSQEIFPHLLAQEMHDIELLVVVFRAPPDAGFPDLAEPFRTVTWGIHFRADTRNAPTAIQRLESIQTRVRSALMVR